ncbi:NAD(P)H-dependent oxidoreductase [Phaeovibrio sulfidiphilus]|uniref:NAD(P)H-dependent oxidoreductase n=1 Tax=Phaeovibrio sulfidiphilus TaxID=1220600 RepID=A0A8J6YPM3_9PROT|nr:NAD(P)H-dependent oxidoreductase [Phaeovibrio sulfidiphilus]MBE1237331.1 NAD(P)H-dependent oxidoreductase [Phaeovibrio sulfidiphilus]
MTPAAEAFKNALGSRFACKVFDPERAVSDADFAAILEAGCMAPSSLGLEPWQFLVIEDRGLRSKIAEVAWGVQRQMPGASRVVMILARKGASLMPDSPYVGKTIMADTQHLSGEPLALRLEKYRDFVTNDFELTGNDRAFFEWACRQCYLAMQNMLMISALMGIDSCPIEGFNKDKLEALMAAEGHLDRETFGIAAMVVFGYQAEGPARPKTRRPVEQVVKVIA